MSTRLSSWPGAGSASGGSCAAASSSRRRRAPSLLMRSVIRREATWISQPTGLSGVLSSGHCSIAAINASCTASSESAKSPNRRTTAPRTCGAASRSRSSMPGDRLTPDYTSELGARTTTTSVSHTALRQRDPAFNSIAASP